MTAPTAAAAERSAPHVFGPVPSRRLGRSLGVDLLPPKTCSYDCVYCELGPTTAHTGLRGEYADRSLVRAELARRLPALEGKLDYVTFAGSGEPTLHAGLGELIDAVKALTATPVAVLTNGSLLSDAEVRRQLAAADLVSPSLDAGTESVFRRVNRPVPEIRFDDMLAGLRAFVRAYGASCPLEVMIVQGVNDAAAEVEALAEALAWISPPRIQLSTLHRPSRSADVRPVSAERLQAIARRLEAAAPVELPADRPAGREPDGSPVATDLLIAALRIRPMTVAHLAAAAGLHPTEVLKRLSLIGRVEALDAERHEGELFYFVRAGGGTPVRPPKEEPT